MEESKNTEAVETFIRRWQGREGGQERANYVSFLNELIVLLGLPLPDPLARLGYVTSEDGKTFALRRVA